MIHRRFGVGGGLSDRVEGLSSFVWGLYMWRWR